MARERAQRRRAAKRKHGVLMKRIHQINSVGHYPNTALFNSPPKKIPWQGSGLSSLGRLIMKSQGLSNGGGGDGVTLFLAIFPGAAQ